MKHRRKAVASIAAVSAAAMLLASCSSGGGGTSSAGDGKGEVTVWAHQGKDSEVAALKDAVSNFNSSQSDVTVKLTLVPEADYTKTIQSTSAKDLPDVLELDGPTLSSFVYDAKVAPIDRLRLQGNHRQRHRRQRARGNRRREALRARPVQLGPGALRQQARCSMPRA